MKKCLYKVHYAMGLGLSIVPQGFFALEFVGLEDPGGTWPTLIAIY